MSWTLFIQICILLLIAGCIALAIIDKLKPKPVRKGKPTVYYSLQKPDPLEPITGDLWVNSETVQVSFYDEKKGDWTPAYLELNGS